MAVMEVRPWAPVDFGLSALMWTIMMVGMMVPTVAPMTLTYAAVARKAARDQTPVPLTIVFASGYVVLWTIFSVLAALAGPWGLLAAVLAVTVAGRWAADVDAARSGADDPGEVVIDEVAGQWLALVPVALDLRLYAVAFLAFRFFDIVKVWPAGWLDRNLKGGWGIMLDDLAAGIYAGALAFGVSLLWPEP